ncbi:methylated-DNA--[protein]-cysteine S-methyltransferase [Thalassotalea ganghwensis]
MYYTRYSSPFGQILMTATQLGLTGLYFEEGHSLPQHLDAHDETRAPFAQACKQLDQYFNKKRQVFDLSLAPQGTSFQQSVWAMLQKISYGETKSYAWLAKAIGNEKAVRAVGAANGKNPISLVIPCHRVIGSNGALTGYAGGLTLKAKLLAFESSTN